MTARNDICPCGSGKRYKHCHGAQDASPLVSPKPAPSANVELAESASLAALRKAARGATADEQLALWRALVAESPGDSEAGFNLGNAARNRRDFAEAAAHYEAALASTPGHSGLVNNLGLVLESLGRLEDAEVRFRDALAVVPDGLQPLANLAQNLFQQARYGDALEYFERLVARHPKIGRASIHANHAVCLMLVNRIADAEAAMAHAMEIEPEHQWIARNRGLLLARKRDWMDAAAMLEKVLVDDPQDMLAASALVHVHGNIANWDDGGAAIEAVLARMRGPAPEFAQVSAIDTLAQIDDPVLQRVAGKGWLHPHVAKAPHADANKERLHLGFVSSDFCNHPVPRLIVGLLEALDRTRLEVTAIASAPQFFHDEMLSRSKRACDRYVEIRVSAAEAASTARVRDLGVDVLFDLNGISGICVPELFAARTAPMQVNFLGYTGTMGSASHDYLIADSYCIPHDMEGEYNERVLRIDPCYLPSDPARVLADPSPARARYGLADDALVLAAFGAPFKIRQAMFAAWMSVMRAHPRAVLWLRPANAQVGANLRRYAT
ncbi:MAG: tetratricopeptide repeat protein, partial [Casimicrobiaceae bacterium]